MAWKDNLQDAAFRGVKFSCRATTDRIERAVALYEFPHRDGAETDDLGARARQVRITAVVWGDAYEAELAQLLATLTEAGAGDLVHPVFGRMRAQLLSCDMRHGEDAPDRCELELSFIESAAPAAFFTAITAPQRAGAAAAKVAAARDTSTVRHAAKAQTLAQQLRGLRQRMDAVDKLAAITRQVRANVRDVVLAGLDVLSYPSSWATDIRAIVQAITSLPRVAASRIDGSLAGWRVLSKLLRPADSNSGALARPVVAMTGSTAAPGGSAGQAAAVVAIADRADVPAAVRLQVLGQDLVVRERALELADAAADLLAQEADVATLTPAEVASVAADARELLQQAVRSAREVYGLEQAHAIGEALRDVAHAVQAAAEAVIVARPPLVQRAVPADGNLHLVAHWWYGDATRADELRRLNPGQARQVVVTKGDLLYGYAR